MWSKYSIENLVPRCSSAVVIVEEDWALLYPYHEFKEGNFSSVDTAICFLLVLILVSVSG